MIDRFSWGLLICAIPLALVLHFLPGSTYGSAAMMDTYFGHENSPGSWTWEHLDVGSWAKEWEPFKYRIVFRSLVDGLAGGLLILGAEKTLHTYWIAYLSVSVAAQVFALWACDRFLHSLGLDATGRGLGILAWLALPPILFAYILPVQTKEDFLAYGLIFLSLRAMLLGQWLQVVVLCTFGAFVRETLLIVSGLMLIGTAAPRRWKLLALLLPIAVHIGLRMALGVNGYQVFRDTNLLSVALPLYALFIIFGFGWLALLPYLGKADLIAPIKLGWASLMQAQTPEPGDRAARLRMLQSAFPFALVLLFIAHFFMGRIQEIRITCLLSPFVLIALVAMLEGGSPLRRKLVFAIIAAGLATVLIGALEATGVMTPVRLAVNPLIAEFANQKWWAMVYLQIILGAGVLGARRASRQEARD